MTIGDYMPEKFGMPKPGLDRVHIEKSMIETLMRQHVKDLETASGLNAKVGMKITGVEDAVQRYVTSLQAALKQKRIAAESLKQQYDNALQEQMQAQDELNRAINYCIEHGIRAISEEEALGGK